MKYQKEKEIEYMDESKIKHTFRVLSGPQRNRIFEEYIDMKAFMARKGKDSNPMEFILEGKGVLSFMNDVLKTSCPTLESDNIPSNILDGAFNELSEFILSGGSKN